MFFYKRRISNKVKKTANEPTLKPSSVQNNSLYKDDKDRTTLCQNHSFSAHMSKYTGQTVTVFVAGGGMSGSGFTGVLLYANEFYIKLLTRVGPAPACPIGSTCTNNFRYCNPHRLANFYYKANNPFLHFINSMGAITYIPVCKITSFIHNTV
jgi:hypothetical protein